MNESDQKAFREASDKWHKNSGGKDLAEYMFKAALAHARSGEAVAYRVHPFDYGIGHKGVYAMTMREEQVNIWQGKGWNIEKLFTHSQPAQHPDDRAVDVFAKAMKNKLAQAREKGKTGWERMNPADLSVMLREHVDKGDPRDVANFCMFLWSIGQPIHAATDTAQQPATQINEQLFNYHLNRKLVAHCRGYALLGKGQYILNHSKDFHPEFGAELIITFATEKDKEGNRQIGEMKNNPYAGKAIEPEDVIIRIGFINELGLSALEKQLSELRKAHFPETKDQPSQATQINDQMLAVLKKAYSVIGYPADDFSELMRETISAAEDARAIVNDIQELERDAMRYRWLRDQSVPPHNFYLSVPTEFDGVRYTPQEVDSYIDAAITAAEAAKEQS